MSVHRGTVRLSTSDPIRGGRCKANSGIGHILLAAWMMASSAVFGCNQVFAGTAMSNVAEMVAELPETYQRLIVWGVDFSPDGRNVAVGTDDYDVNIWDWKDKRIARKLIRPTGTNPSTSTNPLRYANSSHFLAMCLGRADQAYVRVWNSDDWSIVQDAAAEDTGFCAAVGFAADDTKLVCAVDNASSGNVLLVYDTKTWASSSIKVADFHPISLGVSPNGKFAAIAGYLTVRPAGVTDRIEMIRNTQLAPKLYVADLQSLRLIKSLDVKGLGPLAWSSEGSRVVIASGQHVQIIDVTSADTLVDQPVPNSGTMNVMFSPDGRYLIESDLNGSGKGLGVTIWNSSRTKRLQNIAGDIGSIAVSRDGKYLAIGMTGRTTIWRLK